MHIYIVYICTCILVCSTTVATGDCSWFYAANWEWHPQVASRLGDAIAVISPQWHSVPSLAKRAKNCQNVRRQHQITGYIYIYTYIFGI